MFDSGPDERGSAEAQPRRHDPPVRRDASATSSAPFAVVGAPYVGWAREECDEATSTGAPPTDIAHLRNDRFTHSAWPITHLSGDPLGTGCGREIALANLAIYQGFRSGGGKI